MGSDDVKTLVEKRASALADAFTSEDVQKLMSFFSKDVDFSDIAMSAYNLNHTSLRGFYETMYENLYSMASPTSRSPVPHLTSLTWEMDIGFVMKVDDVHLGVKKDQEIVMKGAALQWWREEDGEWKIWKERDYFMIKSKE